MLKFTKDDVATEAINVECIYRIVNMGDGFTKVLYRAGDGNE